MNCMICISLTVLYCSPETQKKEMLQVPLDFENRLTLDSRAYVNTISQIEMDRMIQQASTNIFKLDDPPNFHLQVQMASQRNY